jgi:hypothetical protein
VIVVCGMHRSGTSAVAELLGAFGLDLGDASDLYAADRWNERGYFEQRDVLDLNSEIVCGLPRTRGAPARWLGQLNYLRMPPRAALAARAQRRRARMQALAQRHAGRVVKDPRFCLTLPDWMALGAVDALVACVRHPAAVVDSLWRRQRVPRRLGLRFWNYHVAALLEAAPRVRSLFVAYERLLDADPRALARIDAFFGLGLDADERERLRAKVMHESLSHARAASAELPVASQRLYAELLRRTDF